jgi:N-acyl amino acid synthase of PEP-CTERM/exosortase system
MNEPALPASSLADAFGSNFEITQVGAEQRARIFQLRYRVFCEELGYGMHHDGSHESDDYDAAAQHCLLRHRPTECDVGCFRLLARHPLGHLPCESFGLPFVDPASFDLRSIDLDDACEVSRLAVGPDFRRPVAYIGADGRAQRFPFGVVTLYHAALAMVLEGGWHWVLMVGETRLQRHLQRWGLRWEQISPPFEYYGSRAVFLSSREQLLRDVASWPPAWRELYEGVRAQLGLRG